ncbi:tetratricopeptide repeat protein [Ornithinibacillus sp. L9]|uniref:Tetratricopeptide repeat protein n=1 Tax=Ornithinibacillus caprae TaxID=2678566 RepID=A0A6N8FI06_9BACI|nr:tetratricopeptide repeat protein [Ornithinibacillus caprae]MUK86948.1 tetratricopeptide repeat protein [Ornithinibacillus caprae]
MESENEKIILFPKWRKALEEESLEALKAKRYEEALSKLNQLISFQIHNHEIIIGKLICLMELGRHQEAQELCEEVMSVKDEDYYHYVHIYLTILFQTNQYSLLMDQVDYELETQDIPYMIREQFKQLYDVSSKMIKDAKNEETTEYLLELQEAVEQQDHLKQWRLIESLRKFKSNPDRKVIQLLKNEHVHPVIKTAIFLWLQDNEISEIVDVQKLGFQLHVNPSDMVDLQSHTTIKQTMVLINELEQKNPSLYQLLTQLLNRYAYVRYPLLPTSEDVTDLAEALLYIGEEMLNIHNGNREELTDKQKYYINEIQVCEQLYLSIIED